MPLPVVTANGEFDWSAPHPFPVGTRWLAFRTVSARAAEPELNSDEQIRIAPIITIRKILAAPFQSRQIDILKAPLPVVRFESFTFKVLRPYLELLTSLIAQLTHKAQHKACRRRRYR